MNQIFNTFNKTKSYLIIANVLLVFFLILLSNLGILPLHQNDFIFFAFLTLAFALYRPGWAFLFFIGTLALENINLAPKELGITLRPYQFIGALTMLAIIIRIAVRRINFELPKLKWPDALIGLIILSGFISVINAPDKMLSFKLSIIIVSFGILYALIRIYIQNFEDLKKIVPFFLSSSVIVIIYGIWQNIRFAHNLLSFEVMPGRPNATFAEPDWLGVYLTFCAAVGFSILFYLRFKLKEKFISSQMFLLFIFLVACFVSLILTVSRSAWLTAFLLYVIYATIVWTDLKFKPKDWRFWETARHKWFTVGAMAMALILVYAFHLTTFKLFERAQSTGGMQKITIACEKEVALPSFIPNINELNNYACQHINLEDIEKNKAANKFVTEILRNDPNVNTRKIIYQKSWQEIKNHPILGIGWGSIGKILGIDARGASLNSSNIFLEVYLGSGISGFLAFIGLWIWIIISGIKNFRQDEEKKIYGLLLILGAVALVVPNLFNAGIMLGTLWLFFGISFI